jgi:hypothetical protein
MFPFVALICLTDANVVVICSVDWIFGPYSLIVFRGFVFPLVMVCSMEVKFCYFFAVMIVSWTEFLFHVVLHYSEHNFLLSLDLFCER